MKTYNIDIDKRDSLIEALWEEIQECSGKDVCFVCTPNKNEITIFENEVATPIAKINLIKVSDEYDVKQDIFD